MTVSENRAMHMCGILGFLGSGTGTSSNGEKVLKSMADSLAHRGPDDAGYWLDASRCIGLGHRRLAIVDISPAGHQPMLSSSGRYVIVLNGEIYNHRLLRKELEGAGLAPAWRGHSDTETLLAAIDAWGVRRAVTRAIGMFAFAVWDRQNGTLVLGRDRIGEKPLYYGWQRGDEGAAFLFGSELKALRAHPAFEGSIDRGALSLLLRHNYIPAPYSIYQGIFKLRPGCLLEVSLGRREPRIEAYWSVANAAEAGTANVFAGDSREAVDELELLLKDAVGQQMMADVPLGAFLSGGVDSSTIVALMQAQSSRPVKTFTIGFEEEGYNEAEHARLVATHLGTEHTEMYVTAEQAMAVIPRLPLLYDEPFADQSQIPTFLVSRLARQHVTVALSGDAGDELFCGYQRYPSTENLIKSWNKITAGPFALRKLVAAGLTSVSADAWNKLAGTVEGLLPRSLRGANIGNKLHKGAGALASRSPDALYWSSVSYWHDPASVVLHGYEPPTLLHDEAPEMAGLDTVQRLMALDMLTYLPDDILVKVDRAAMGVSLETRAPFLDHRVVEFAWRLPQSMKLRDGHAKWALRQVLDRYVPRSLIERPKMGFAIPVGHWLRGPLRDWADALLDDSRLRHDGFFHADLIRRKWKEHLSGEHNWEYHLWGVLMFQAWAGHNKFCDAHELSDASVVPV